MNEPPTPLVGSSASDVRALSSFFSSLLGGRLHTRSMTMVGRGEQTVVASRGGVSLERSCKGRCFLCEAPKLHTERAADLFEFCVDLLFAGAYLMKECGVVLYGC